MKKSLIILTIFLSNIIFSQTNEKNAFKVYKEAKSLYFENNYKEAAQSLYKTIELNGKTNLQVQTLLVLALYKSEQWNSLENEINNYFQLNPDTKLNEHNEILLIKKKLDSYLKEEKEYYKQAKFEKTKESYEKYINKFPLGKNIIEIKTLLNIAKDEDAWNIALQKNNFDSMHSYLDNFPNGKNTTIAKDKIEKWDYDAKNEALKIDTQLSLKKYLTEYNKGKYKKEVEDRLKVKIEEDLFALATSSNDINLYKNYLNNYPYGKYTSQANEYIENEMFNNVKKGIEKREYRNSLNEANNYIESYPNGKNISQVLKWKNKAERNLKKINAGMLLLTYETDESYGLQFGSLRKKNLGWYFSLRCNKNVLDASFKEENILTPDQFNQIDDDLETISASSSIGLTFPIAYPIYLSAGAGVNYREFSFYNEIADKTILYSVEGIKMYEIFPESNLIVRMGPVIISGGASYIREEIVYKVGLGFKF